MADKIYTPTEWVDEELANDPRYNILDDGGDPIEENVQLELETEVVVAGTAGTAARMNNIEDGIDDIDDRIVALLSKFILDVATEITVSDGTLTLTQSLHKVQPESGTEDDVDNFAGMTAGQQAILTASDVGVDTLNIKHGTGNISCMAGADIALSEGAILIYYDGTTYYVSGGGGGGDGEAVTSWANHFLLMGA